MYKNSPSSVTVADATKKLERYCAYQERCHQDVENKLRTMKLIPEAREKIILHLLTHNFLNEERFAKSFARGKFTIKKWGKQRIVRELKARDISTYNIKIALQEITEEKYIKTFHLLAEKKFDSIGEENSIKKRNKLTRYLLHRGWETNMVYEKVHELIPF